MSKENVRQFIKRIQTDQSLQEKLKNVPANNENEQLEVLIKLGEEAGHIFTAEEYKQAIEEALASMRQHDELGDAELEAVAGGSNPWTNAGNIVSAFTLGIGCQISYAQQKDCFINKL